MPGFNHVSFAVSCLMIRIREVNTCKVHDSLSLVISFAQRPDRPFPPRLRNNFIETMLSTDPDKRTCRGFPQTSAHKSCQEILSTDPPHKSCKDPSTVTMSKTFHRSGGRNYLRETLCRTSFLLGALRRNLCASKSFHILPYNASSFQENLCRSNARAT